MKGERVVFQRPCPVCGASAGDYLTELRFAVFDDEILPAELPLAACPDCGHSFYDGDLSPDQVEEHYRRNNYYATSLTPGAGGESDADRRHQRQIIERFIPWLPPGFNRPIYDVGCGRGGLLRALAEAGLAQATGLELLPLAVEMVRAGGLAALEGSALRLPSEGSAPGLLIYSHVFEHLLAPAEALAEARRRLAPAGLVYIEVPDASRYDSAVPWRALYQEHLGHFGPASLERLLLRSGFEIRALEQGEFPLPGGRSEGVIWAVAGPKMAGSSPSRPPQQAPDQGIAALRLYLEDCSRHPMMKTLTSLADSRRPLKVWGLSQMTLLLLGSSALGRANLQGFIDADPSKRARRLGGREVAGPDSLAGGPSEAELLLAVWGREDEMLASLRNMGFQGIVHRLSGVSTIL